MKLKMKTTITLLIAILMTSVFAVAYAQEGRRLVVPESEREGLEDSIVIDMPEGFTLGQLDTISWSVYMDYGYPLHVDIILGTDIDGDSGNIDSLTAEIGENDNPENLEMGELLADYSYDTWLKTFEHSVGTGDSVVDDDTVLWVTRLGAGCDNAPYGTLLELKAGEVTYPLGSDIPAHITINENVIVLRLEFEIDNWLGEAEAYVDDIQVNDVDVDLLLEVLSPIVSIMVAPTSVDFGKLKYGVTAEADVTVFNIGDIKVDVTVDIDPEDGFFDLYLSVSDPGEILPSANANIDLALTVPYGTTPDIYTGTLVFTATPAYPDL